MECASRGGEKFLPLVCTSPLMTTSRTRATDCLPMRMARSRIGTHGEHRHSLEEPPDALLGSLFVSTLPAYGFVLVAFCVLMRTISHIQFISSIYYICFQYPEPDPFDIIKTRIQTAPWETPRTDLKIVNITRALIRDNGWRYMFRGLGVTLVRAFPVNATVFPVYEFTLDHLVSSGIGGRD